MMQAGENVPDSYTNNFMIGGNICIDQISFIKQKRLNQYYGIYELLAEGLFYRTMIPKPCIE